MKSTKSISIKLSIITSVAGCYTQHYICIFPQEIKRKAECNIQIIGYKIKLNSKGETMAFDEVNSKNIY